MQSFQNCSRTFRRCQMSSSSFLLGGTPLPPLNHFQSPEWFRNSKLPNPFSKSRPAGQVWFWRRFGNPISRFQNAGMFWNCSGGMYIYPYLLNCDAKERDIPAIRSKLLGGLSVCLSVCLSVLSVNVVTVLGTFVTVTLSPSFTLPSVLTLRWHRVTHPWRYTHQSQQTTVEI